MMATPFYHDWTFWTAVVAFLALVLSQLPPLYVLFRPAKLDVEAFDRIHVLHNLGDPNAMLQLVISNSGGREVKIKSISLNFHPDGSEQFELQSRGYFHLPSDQTAIIFTPFRLKSHEEWSHIVNFFSLRSRVEEREVNQFVSAIKNNILPRKAEPGNDKVVLEAPSELVAPAIDYFHHKFKWRADEYELALNVTAEPKKASITKKYRITIFESDNIQMIDETKQYKYGAGVYFNNTERAPIFLPLIPLSR